MNCRNFEDNVTDLARQAPFEASMLEETRAHAEQCGSCATKLSEQHELSLALRGLATKIKAIQVPDHIESRLLAEFRKQKLVRPASAASRRWLALAAAAAVVIVAAGVVGMRLRSTQQSPAVVSSNVSPPTTKTSTNMPTPGESATLNTTPVNSSSNPRRVVLKHRHQAVRNSSAVAIKPVPDVPTVTQSEVTTDFMTLGDVSTASLQEGAQVFRVELPRYAMARFGLPVNMERYDEKVKADVWVGVDGLARAIRFVQ
jgi:hypothetical protein